MRRCVKVVGTGLKLIVVRKQLAVGDSKRPQSGVVREDSDVLVTRLVHKLRSRADLNRLI